MAYVNRRPPFLFRLNREIEIDNERFYHLKKEDDEISVKSLISRGPDHNYNDGWKEKVNQIVSSKLQTNL